MIEDISLFGHCVCSQWTAVELIQEEIGVKTLLTALLTIVLQQIPALAQSPAPADSAGIRVQVSEVDRSNRAESAAPEFVIPAGTPLEIEAADTVNSRDMRKGDFLSFRVLVPVKVDGTTVIESDSLVTARVLKAKRGGHWGKAGKLAWAMQDVVAVDLTRVPLTAHPEMPSKVTGTSHGAEVATKTIVFGVLLAPFASPLALMSGFKRGEDAVLPQGKRFVVYVEKDTLIHMPVVRSGQ